MSGFYSPKYLCLQNVIKWPMIQWLGQLRWPVVWPCTLSIRKNSLPNWSRFSLRFSNSFKFPWLLAWDLHFPFLPLAFRLDIVPCKAPLRCDLRSATLPPCPCLYHILYAFKTTTGADSYFHGLPSTSSLHSVSQRRNWGWEGIRGVRWLTWDSSLHRLLTSYQVSCPFSSLLGHLTACCPVTPSHSDSSQYTVMLLGCQSH